MYICDMHGHIQDTSHQKSLAPIASTTQICWWKLSVGSLALLLSLSRTEANGMWWCFYTSDPPKRCPYASGKQCLHSHGMLAIMGRIQWSPNTVNHVWLRLMNCWCTGGLIKFLCVNICQGLGIENKFLMSSIFHFMVTKRLLLWHSSNMNVI